MQYKQPNVTATVIASEAIPGYIYRAFGEDFLCLGDTSKYIKNNATATPFMVLSQNTPSFGQPGNIVAFVKNITLVPLGRAEISVKNN